MRRSYDLFGFLGWVLFIFVPTWGRELYIRAFGYVVTSLDTAWDSIWRLLLLILAVNITTSVARHFGMKYRKTWISFLVGIVLGGLFQVLLAMFVFGFEF